MTRSSTTKSVSSSPSNNKKFSEFEFNEDDEKIEMKSKNFLNKFVPIFKKKPRRSPRHHRTRSLFLASSNSPSPVDKYTFLQYFAGTKAVRKSENVNEPIVVEDGTVDAHSERGSGSKGQFEKSEDPVVNIDAKIGCCSDFLSVDASPKCVVRENVVDIEAISSGCSNELAVSCHERVVRGDVVNVEDNSPGKPDKVIVLSQNCEVGDEVINIDANSAKQSDKRTASSPVRKMQEHETAHVDAVEEDCAVVEMQKLDVTEPSTSSKYENDVDGMTLDDDGPIKMSSSSTSNCTLEDNEVPSIYLEPGWCFLGHKIDSTNNTVAVFPDFIVFRDIYSTVSCLTFSSSCIRVEGSAINGTKGTFNAEWAIVDVIGIECRWCQRVETASLTLQLKPNVSDGVGNLNEPPGTDTLKMTVYDPYWSEGQEAIKLLDFRYKEIWNANLETDWDNAFTGSNSIPIPKPSLSVLDKACEDVIYPEGDPDPVIISKRDVELLQPETFINDTIIDFYIKYLRNKIPPEDQHRFHFFNSFFFRKLADLDKDPSSVHEGRAAFERVRKWTKKVNLFDKDYVFIPVNYSLHWSLIVICHPGEIAHFRDEECGNACRLPCILHMDSIRGSHRGLENLIQSYLCEEWKEKHNESMDDVSSKFSRLRFVELELPQQENSFDCGLFLLHYVELFLEDVPANFNPFKITEFSNFLNRNWFLPEEVSLKRSRVQRLICEILEDRFQKVPQVESCSQFFEKDGKEIEIQFHALCSSVKMYPSESLSPNSEIRAVLSPPLASPLKLFKQQMKEPGLDFRGLFDRGTSVKLSLSGNHSQTEARHLSFMSPIKEDEDFVERISNTTSDSEDYNLNAGLETESLTSLFRNYFKSSETSSEPNGLRFEDVYVNDSGEDSSSESYCSDSQKSSEIGIDDDDFHHQFDRFDYPVETKRQDSLASSDDLETCIIEDSEEAKRVHKGSRRTQNEMKFSSIDKIASKDNVSSSKNLMSEIDEQAA